MLTLNIANISNIIWKNQAQGETKGFHAGGAANTTNLRTNIDSFPFAVPFATTTYTGDLASGQYRISGTSSTTAGFVAGGSNAIPDVVTLVVQSFPFTITVGGTATSPGVLAANSYDSLAGATSTTSGYRIGGTANATATVGLTSTQQFPFAANFPIADVNTMATAHGRNSGMSSDTRGFVASGFGPTSSYNYAIEYFPFAAPFATSTNIGTQGASATGKSRTTGLNSMTHGYTVGGFSGSPGQVASATINFFPFALPLGTSVVSGTSLSTTFGQSAGVSSYANGYFLGGATFAGASPITAVGTLLFSSGATANSIGNLNGATYAGAGVQY